MEPGRLSYPGHKTCIMVEVFKTNVTDTAESVWLVRELLLHAPKHRINFDLGDCDRILRVEGENICTDSIIAIVKARGYVCEILS